MDDRPTVKRSKPWIDDTDASKRVVKRPTTWISQPGTGRMPVPVSALRFTAGEFQLGDNGGDAKTAPFRMVARSGQPIEHWYWGRVVHDMSGVQHKGRCPIDYAHSDTEVIGYANHFETGAAGLEVSGALVPYKDNDRATEVIYKQKNGVPYEASINFGGGGIRMENVAEGDQTEVNGYTFDGPGVVVREWPLRGVAICPYGADANTSTTFTNDEQVEVEFMAKTTKSDELEAAAVAVEKEPVTDKATEAVVVTTELSATTAAVEEAAPDVTLKDDQPEEEKPEGLRFLEAFGPQGGVWFALGMSFDEAQVQYVAKLKEENEQLKAKLDASSLSGEREPVAFSEAKSDTKKQPLIRISGKQY